ncbi:hypothetical protein TVAG_300820 [Trichomonas vaginalis G3]|uniref:Uncharacterized protein n=1 Tax=Trichomonas vaginalis (strain ATCC PRA-98 / G3) TaxID=412133 RepID=A2FKL3_TRIV3|nr:hypothetical protein TVAGG3_0271030 [Trichomonas vaginalis G3]EAX94549.1 hypothetical protein TVAG_300820 [Trichomonas vaginalis G3]KAI5525863.1 hypothetical protein TVAGG3_0271030 [Trichomonas vaginalis G3]|eukprot:XP_001307479.1 hypothetical protein [Trichomonas vaginalis G3]
MPAAPYCYVPEESPFLEGSQLKTKSVYFDAEEEDGSINSFQTFYSSFYDEETSESSSMSTSNPYEDSTESDEIECDYILPTPDILLLTSRYNLPDPQEKTKPKFSYTLANGKVLELENPLPSCLPIEILCEGEETEEPEEPAQASDNALYVTSAVCPIAGYIAALILKSKRPQLARRLKNISNVSMTVLGSILLILLL